MRSLVACIVAMVLLGLVVATSIIACPYLQPDSKASHGCCSKSHTRGKKCPLSSTEETCPLYLSEAKLGITKDKFDLGMPGPLVAPVFVTARVWVGRSATLTAPAAETDLYLANRVLRI
jgi:hypothetical protein